MPPDGYAWWYADGISSDGLRAISVIAFIGSVFSPWYRWSGRRDPHNHCCINVTTCGPGGRFTMTDRGRSALSQSRSRLAIGPSSLEWTGRELVISLDERGALPRLGRVRGTVVLRPAAVTGVELPLTPEGTHIWRPFAPVAEIEVALEAPGWQWQGHGYGDANFGTRALEADFAFWSWGRFPAEDGTRCFYDARRRDGSTLAQAFRFTPDGSAHAAALPPQAHLPRSAWALHRPIRTESGPRPRQLMHMLDAPFYSRAVVEAQIGGAPSTGVYEALDLARFRQPWLKPMLAVRVLRRARWKV